MTNVRVDVFYDNKKIGNFEGNLNEDSFRRSRGTLLEENKSLEDIFIQEISETTNINKTAIKCYQIAKSWYQKKFDEAAEKQHNAEYTIMAIRKALFGKEGD